MHDRKWDKSMAYTVQNHSNGLFNEMLWDVFWKESPEVVEFNATKRVILKSSIIKYYKSVGILQIISLNFSIHLFSHVLLLLSNVR